MTGTANQHSAPPVARIPLIRLSAALIVAASALTPTVAIAQHTPPIAAERVAHGPTGAPASRIAVRDPVSGRIVESIYSDRTGRLLERRFYTPPPTPDLNGDGVVDAADLAALAARLGAGPTARATPRDPDAADLNTDGAVDSADLLILLNAIGEPIEPPPADIPTAAAITRGCMQQCPDGEWISCDSLCGLGTGPGDGTDGLGDGGSNDCPDYDPECNTNGGPGDGGGGNNNGNNDDDDDDDDDSDCGAEREPTEDNLPPPGIGTFRSDFGLSISTKVGWIGDASISMGGSSSVTVRDTCCPDQSSPSLAFDYHGSLGGSASFRAGILPNSRGDIQIPLAGLGEIKVDYSYGPQFEASASLFAVAAGNWVPTAPGCPQCVTIGVMGDFELRGYIGIDFGVELLSADFFGPWGGTECEPGFTFRITAMAGVETSGRINAVYNLSNCNDAPPGLVSGSFQHDEVRTVAVMEFNVHGAQRVVPIGQWDVLPRIDVPL